LRNSFSSFENHTLPLDAADLEFNDALELRTRNAEMQAKLLNLQELRDFCRIKDAHDLPRHHTKLQQKRVLATLEQRHKETH
jgi:hypothetical protein